MKAILFAAILIPSFLTACMPPPDKSTSPLEVVEHVELTKYTGEWYEIARYPNKFQEGCQRSKATYSLRADGKITVLNECFDQGFSTLIKSAKGRAWVVDEHTNAKLKVSFFWPFSGDYWIIDLGKDYEYAVVGHPQRKYLWILSRTPRMDQTLYGQILDKIKKQGYDTSKLIYYQQTGE